MSETKCHGNTSDSEQYSTPNKVKLLVALEKKSGDDQTDLSKLLNKYVETLTSFGSTR